MWPVNRCQVLQIRRPCLFGAYHLRGEWRDPAMTSSPRDGKGGRSEAPANIASLGENLPVRRNRGFFGIDGRLRMVWNHVSQEKHSCQARVVSGDNRSSEVFKNGAPYGGIRLRRMCISPRKRGACRLGRVLGDPFALSPGRSQSTSDGPPSMDDGARCQRYTLERRASRVGSSGCLAGKSGGPQQYKPLQHHIHIDAKGD